MAEIGLQCMSVVLCDICTDHPPPVQLGGGVDLARRVLVRASIRPQCAGDANIFGVTSSCTSAERKRRQLMQRRCYVSPSATNYGIPIKQFKSEQVGTDRPRKNNVRRAGVCVARSGSAHGCRLIPSRSSRRVIAQPELAACDATAPNSRLQRLWVCRSHRTTAPEPR